MDIKGRITHVEFEPNNYFRVRGMANSAFNDSRLWGERSDYGFDITWFWFDSSMPPEVLEAFNEVIALIDTKLQWQGILPKQWPGVLDNTDHDADIFKFKVKKYSIANPVWLSAKERSHTVTVTASSKWFTDGKDIEKEINLRFDDDELSSLFKTLDKHL